jgi:hypothetical protein
MPNPSTAKLVSLVCEGGEDFEFYPTTDEIIDALAKDIKRQRDKHYRYDMSSVLDIGAGNGKVLAALRERAEMTSLHAIEKSPILCEQLPADVLIVGTEFAAQSLLSKHVDVTFCNPPYSDFEQWAVKIVRESASLLVYLVIPERWARSDKIADALRYREAECHKVGDFDFLSAEDRAARAKVHLLRITLKHEGRHRESEDAFERFFKESFAHLIDKFEGPAKTHSEAKRDEFAELVVGPGYVDALVSLYNTELGNVQRNFDLVGKLDVSLLKEFNINPQVVMECLKTRLSGLRSDYWQELFSHLEAVTNRLTSRSRRALLDTLQRHVHVDFTESNIHAVVVWVIKNANLYLESQLIETYEHMVDKCNVIMYKSNAHAWVEERWRYSSEPRQNSHYGLDYRIVTHRMGGMRSSYGYTELEESAGEFLGDLLTVARNLGFECTTNPHLLNHSGRREWTGGERYEFHGMHRGRSVVLFDVRAFKNRNLHIRFAKPLILALNVEHGRLKGWLRSREEAAEELKDTEAAQHFRANKLLTSASMPLLAAPQPQVHAA